MKRYFFLFFVSCFTCLSFISCPASVSSENQTASVLVTLPDSRAIVSSDDSVSDYSGGTYTVTLTGSSETFTESSVSGETIAFTDLAPGSYTIDCGYFYNDDCVAWGTDSVTVAAGEQIPVELTILLNKASRIESLAAEYTAGTGSEVLAGESVSGYILSVEFKAVLSNGYECSLSWDEAADTGVTATLVVTGAVDDYDFELLLYLCSSEFLEDDSVNVKPIPIALDLSGTEGVSEIQSCAFLGADELVSIVFPETLVTIGSQAFDSCTGLVSVTIPLNVTSIGSKCFDACTALSEVVFEDTECTWTVGSDTTLLVTDPAANAKYLSETYYSEAWTKGTL